MLGYGAMCFGRQLDLPAAKRLLTVLKQSGVNLYDNAEASRPLLASSGACMPAAELLLPMQTYCKGQSEEVFGQAVRVRRHQHAAHKHRSKALTKPSRLAGA